MPAFPDTSLEEDVLDSPYGGQPANAFGQPSWSWINSVVRLLSKAFLAYTRAPHSTVVLVSTDAAQAGDVACFDAGAFVSERGYLVKRYSGTMTAPRVVGVYLEPVTAGQRARVATAGIISPTVTGLGAASGARLAGLDATSGRIREAVSGDLVLGDLDLQGNLFFFAGYGLAP